MSDEDKRSYQLYVKLSFDKLSSGEVLDLYNWCRKKVIQLSRDSSLDYDDKEVLIKFLEQHNKTIACDIFFQILHDYGKIGQGMLLFRDRNWDIDMDAYWVLYMILNNLYDDGMDHVRRGYNVLRETSMSSGVVIDESKINFSLDSLLRNSEHKRKTLKVKKKVQGIKRHIFRKNISG